MNMDFWELFANTTKEIFVIVNGQVGVHTALHEDLRAADGDEFFNFAIDCGVIEGVGIRGGFVVAFECAEGAAGRCRYSYS